MSKDKRQSIALRLTPSIWDNCAYCSLVWPPKTKKKSSKTDSFLNKIKTISDVYSAVASHQQNYFERQLCFKLIAKLLERPPISQINFSVNYLLISSVFLINVIFVYIIMISKKAEEKLTKHLDWDTQYELSVDAPLVKELVSRLGLARLLLFIPSFVTTPPRHRLYTNKWTFMHNE